MPRILSKRASDKISVVVLSEFVAVFVANPRVRVVRRVKKKKGLSSVEARNDFSPIVAFDLNVLETAIHSRQTLNPLSPPLYR
jgi:hypothetical protein